MDVWRNTAKRTVATLCLRENRLFIYISFFFFFVFVFVFVFVFIFVFVFESNVLRQVSMTTTIHRCLVYI